MANSVGNFIPEVWSKKLTKIFHKNSVFLGIVNRDYEGEIKKAGDVVHVRTYGNIVINDYTRNQTLAAQDLSDPMESMQINKQKYFYFLLDDLDKAQSDIKILEGYTKEAGIEMRNTIDKDIHAHYADVASGHTLGTSGAPISLTKSDVYDYMTQLAEIHNAANVGREGRHVVVNPKTYRLLQNSPEFTHATGMGDKVIMNGRVGTVAGMTVHVSTNLNKVGSATPLLALTRDFISYASQLQKVKHVEPSEKFMEGVKGLNLYGSAVLNDHEKAGAVLWVAD